MIKRIALLVVGDKKINIIRANRSFRNFIKYAQRLEKRGKLELKVINYAQLLSGKVPQMDSASIKVIFFFPYKYWNRNIEIYRDGRIYGDKKFGQEFKSLFKKVKNAIDKHYRDKRIQYLNPPGACCLDRDKKASKDLLRKNRVPTPRTFRVSSFKGIQRLVNKGVGLYIKPRFGAMGKGITYIDRGGVISNFLFRKGKIINRPGDYNWRFTWIKNEKTFLNKLLRKDFICEEAIESAVFRGRRFDFRVYVIFGKVVYLYAKSNKVSSCLTNWSQGGKIDKKKRILKTLIKGEKALLKKLAKRANRALGLNFTGIDIIFSKGMKNAYVLEGNAFPGYEKGFDLMKCLLGSLIK